VSDPNSFSQLHNSLSKNDATHLCSSKGLHPSPAVENSLKYDSAMDAVDLAKESGAMADFAAS